MDLEDKNRFDVETDGGSGDGSEVPGIEAVRMEIGDREEPLGEGSESVMSERFTHPRCRFRARVSEAFSSDGKAVFVEDNRGGRRGPIQSFEDGL